MTYIDYCNQIESDFKKLTKEFPELEGQYPQHLSDIAKEAAVIGEKIRLRLQEILGHEVHPAEADKIIPIISSLVITKNPMMGFKPSVILRETARILGIEMSDPKWGRDIDKYVKDKIDEVLGDELSPEDD